MGSLTAATPLSLGPSIGQQSNAQGAFTNIIPCTQSMPGTGGTGGWTDAGTNSTSICEPWSTVFYPRTVIAAAVSDYYVSPAFTTPLVGFAGAFSGSFQVSGDSNLAQLTGQTISRLCRFQINWTGGAGRTDYIDIDPVSGTIAGNQNITAVFVDSFYTLVPFSLANSRALVHEVQFTVSALPAGVTGATARFYASISLAGARVCFGAAQCVAGSVVPEYTPSQIVGGGLNASVFGQPVRGTVAPRYPRVFLTDNYTVDQALDSGLELVQTVAGKTITFQSSVAAGNAPYNVIGCDIKITNASGGALTVQGNAVGVFKGPGFAAAGVTSFSMPSAATYPNNSITLTGDLKSGSTTVYDWYITSSSVGVFNSSGVPVTPTLAPGGAGTIIRSDGTNWAVSQSTYPDLIASGNVLFATAANTIGSANNFTFASNILTVPTITATTGVQVGSVNAELQQNSTGVINIVSPGATRARIGISTEVPSTGYYAFNSGIINVGTTDNYLTRGGANQLVFSATATTQIARTEINKAITSIANNTATATFTVTVPNSAQSASIRVRLTGSLGAGGAIGANESTQDAEYHINVTRTAGANAVATIGAVTTQAAAASVAGAANAATTGTLSAISGAVGATNTFTINVTIARSGGTSDNHTCFAFAELLNANASGVTIA